MSAIFISHSSADRNRSRSIRNQLKKMGFGSVFLDFHVEDGIPAGTEWEQHLYRHLRQCRTVVVLCTRRSMASRWCFAEIAYARALNKRILPVKIAECRLHGLLKDMQIIDLTSNPRDGYRRLKDALVTSGLEPSDYFQWKPGQCPYPGLLAFEESDSAVFFGREDEIREALDALTNVRRFGRTRVLLFVGASGSGKSSLLRAGVIPKLRRQSDEWLIVGPFRPRDQPIEELAAALRSALAPRKIAASTIARQLERAAESDPPDAGPLLKLCRDLRAASGHRDASVLIVIDQLEEALKGRRNDACDRFARLLRSGLETEHCPFIVAGTLRADYLTELQRHTAFHDLAFEKIFVGPPTAAGYRRVIEGPAEVADLPLEPGLADSLLRDLETDDALPLLAFALRQLWEHRGVRGRLETKAYRQLGRLQGCIARVAEAAVDPALLSPGEIANLRSAFWP